MPLPRRRSKRFNYADADRVYARGMPHADVGNETGEIVCSDNLSLHPLNTSPFARGVTSKKQKRFGVLSRLRTRLQQQWQMTQLSLLRTPYVGAVVVRLLEASAYVAYVKGSVVLFTRHSASPPITEVTAKDVRHEESGKATQHLASSKSDSLSSSSLSSRGAALSSLGALDCLYIGQSNIHSRGLFTSKALPKGTRIIREAHRSLLISPHFLTLLADTHEKLPDTWHYTQPTGSVVELVTKAQPHHLLNHSCRANVCSGLSHVFWGAATLAADKQMQQRSRAKGMSDLTGSPVALGEKNAADSVLLQDRLTQWSYFADANSFFVTRDVAAGEELTLDYSTRMAPLYADESRHGVRAQGWLLCRCGEQCCRHYVYRPSAEAAAYLHRLHASRGGFSSSSHQQRQQHWSVDVTGEDEFNRSNRDVKDPLYIAANLLALGFDDELVLLSYAARPSEIVAYLYGQPLHSFSGAVTQFGIDAERRRVSKRELLMSYRYVFRLLNEAVPQSPRHAAGI